MPTFSAINVEPEESIDEEVDNTKQIQVDDALKLFQTALKLHAQGARSRYEATEAYDALFQSAIFKYPEASTEYDRAERQPDPFLALETDIASGLDVAGNDPDGLGDSLQQALYLSFKNHGQFLLDGIRHKAHAPAVEDAALVFDEPEVVEDAHKALDDLSTALDRDPSDADLWRKTARVAAFLKSARIGRHCLEAAIELDDDPAVVEVEPPSLAEGFAGQQLKAQLEVLGDEMALSHPMMGAFTRRELSAALKRYMDPIPWLPDPTTNLATLRRPPLNSDSARLVIEVGTPSWADLGLALVQFFTEQSFSGQGLVLEIPDIPDEDEVLQMEIDKQLASPKSIEVAPVASPQQIPEAAEKTENSVTNEATGDESKEKDRTPTQDAPKAVTIKEGEDKDAHKEAEKGDRKDRSVSLPSRKRSQSAAGLQEPTEEEAGETKRSKRTRRRDTAAEEIVDPNAAFIAQLELFQAADKNLYQLTKQILETIGVTDQPTMDTLNTMLDLFNANDRTTVKLEDPVSIELRQAITSFKETSAKILLNKKDAPALGLNAFLEHTKTGSKGGPEIPSFDEAHGLKAFVRRINDGWFTIQDVAYEWILAISKSYSRLKWADRMKTSVVQLMSRLDEPIYQRIRHELDQSQEGGQASTISPDIELLVQMLFELYLDVYERITNPNSVVDYPTRMETRGRLGRWQDMASHLRRWASRADDDDLSLRFLWASVFSTTMAEGVSRDHVLACWGSLRDCLADIPQVDISLPNNAIMPKISAKAADLEISKLTTMDFFLGLFQEEIGDPLAVIETLEPVLNPASVYVQTDKETRTSDVNGDAGKQRVSRKPITECATQGLRDLWKFLERSTTDLRLFVWGRLGDAYRSIKYPTKQFSCYLRSIEMVVADLGKEEFTGVAPDVRKQMFMQMLKSLDDLIINALSLALNDNTAFDIIEEAHIQSTASALAKLGSILHTAAMYEDEVRIGFSPPAATGSTFQSFLLKLREMQVRVWSLQYTVVKVGMFQNKAQFEKIENDLADYLSAIHQVLGPRKYCKCSNKIFLKMMRVELLKQKNIENWEDYLGQVLYDLHGLKLGVGVWEVQEHGCPQEKLERKSALSLVEKITDLANHMPMKDLLKSDLKNTIEHMQQAIGQGKSTTRMIHNLRYFTEHLKKPIHPLRLYQAWKGCVTLDAATAVTPDTVLATHGWFFLLAMIALSRFKTVDLNRRQTPGATDDLRLSAQYLRFQLQFTPDRWDTWFRLAECFDYELDEAVLWSAEKINKERTDLVKLQRNIIHCYTLALSYSRSILHELTVYDKEALADMYHNFGMRMYASSREPFTMEPFQHADQERFFIEPMGAGTYKKILHGEMSDYQVWKYAAGLFSKAIASRPKDWKNHYMLSKCVWKMYQKPDDQLNEKERLSKPTVEKVLEVLERAVEIVALLPKPRSGQDPVLEPHYKIFAIIHKLVTRKELDPQQGADILQRQPLAALQGHHIEILDAVEWKAFAISTIRHLKDKDKSNWQHRLIMRHARIAFDVDQTADCVNGFAPTNLELWQASDAFSILKENMFTKTMVMNVWKCDAERPGRHHVYTAQYVRYMTRLLLVMNDRVNMEALLRRIRKKGADFYHFNDLWQHCVMSYVKLLRQTYQMKATEEEVFKNTSPEEFEIMSERITEWVSTTDVEHPALSAMKDAIELKKLNGGLTKAGAVDDLIADCYGVLYFEIGPTLPGEDPAKTIEERNRVKAEADKVATDKAGEAGLEMPKLLQNFLNPGDKENTSSRAGSEAPDKPGELTTRRGRPGLRRPDITRKAEQAILRLTEPPKSVASASARGEGGRKSRMGSTSSARNRRAPSGGDGAEDRESGDEDKDGDVAMKDGEDEVDGEDGGGNGDAEDEGGESEGSSPRGSVHDSADDESDLSDVPPDYEENAPALFPNLRRSIETSVGPGGDDTSDDEDDDDDDVEEAAPRNSSPMPMDQDPDDVPAEEGGEDEQGDEHEEQDDGQEEDQEDGQEEDQEEGQEDDEHEEDEENDDEQVQEDDQEEDQDL